MENVCGASLESLKTQIASGRLAPDAEITVLAVNGRFAGYTDSANAKGIKITAGELLQKLLTIVGKTR